MGFFKNLLKSADKKSFVMDIARLITNNDEQIIRNFDYADDPWSALTEKLEEGGYLFSVDYKESLETFLWALEQIKTYSLIDIDISSLNLDAKEDIKSWGEKINSALDGKACISFIDISGDSYELIIVTGDIYEKISAIAQNNGYSIEAF